MITLKKGQMPVFERDPEADLGKYSAKAISGQLRDVEKRISKRMAEVKRNEERSWENSRRRNSGL